MKNTFVIYTLTDPPAYLCHNTKDMYFSFEIGDSKLMEFETVQEAISYGLDFIGNKFNWSVDEKLNLVVDDRKKNTGYLKLFK